MVNDILKYVNEDEAIKLLQDMVQINTVNEPGNEMDVVKYLKDYFDEEEIESEIQDLGNNRGNIVATIFGGDKKKALMLNGHIDTVAPGDVKWDYDPLSGAVADGKIYGRGTADMKGGLAAFIIAMKAIRDSKTELDGDLIFSAVSGEEIDSIGAKAYIDKYGLDNIGGILIGEPCSGDINIAEKGAYWLKLTTYGKTAHGSFPEKGINAIEAMNKLINKLLAYKPEYDVNPLLGDWTMNISTINGGVNTNVVPDTVELTIDMRTVPGQDHKDIYRDIENIFKDLEKEDSNFKASIEVLNDRPAVETKADDPFVKMAQKVIKERFDLDKEPKGVNFYTDASVFLPAKDLPCIFYGPGESSMAHQPNEHITIESYMETIEFYIAMILEYFKN